MVIRFWRTTELTATERAEARALLGAAFDDFADEDWAHALGGVHVLAVDADGRLVGHGSLVPRQFRHDGRPLRCGYVEAVAVHRDLQRRGLGSAVMASLEELAPGFDLLALSSSEQGVPLYRARGWLLWRGPSSVMTADGPVRTPDEDGSIYVLPGTARLDLDGELTCDWRDGDVW